MSNPKQLELHFQYGISSEQACILCHLSASCSGCCLKCGKKDGCQGQVCSQPFKDHEGQRWDTWMYLVTTQLTHLLKYIPKELRKKYGIKPKCPAHHAQGKSAKMNVPFAGLIERAKEQNITQIQHKYTIYLQA